MREIKIPVEDLWHRSGDPVRHNHYLPKGASLDWQIVYPPRSPIPEMLNGLIDLTGLQPPEPA
jgi:hypothetical protein